MYNRELKIALHNHIVYCQEQLQKAGKEYDKYNGFYSQQYESIQEHKKLGLDFMQWSSLKRKAKTDLEFWDKEFEIAVKEFYSCFSSDNEAKLFLLMCC